MQVTRFTNIILLISSVIFSGKENIVSAQSKPDLQKIDLFLQSKLAKSNIPGFAVAIVDDNEIIFSKGYGKSSNNQAVTGNTTFAIASLSKAFTALAVIQMVQAGKLQLDSTVGHYLSNFPLSADKITIRQLLNQTSGLSDLVFPEMKFNTQPYNLASSIERLNKVQLADKPGDKFYYHNPNYQILARLVEVVSGKDFSNYLYNNIFMPLQMNHTCNYIQTKDFYTIDSLSEGHAFIFGYPLKMKELNWFVEGSAGMVSSVNDMAQWLMMNLSKGKYRGNQFVSTEGINLMQSPPNSKSNYGMGWFIDKMGNLNHNGILWTYQADQMILTEQGYGIIILFNSGLNAFQDYSSFTQGISTLLKKQNPDATVIPTILYEVLAGVAVIMAFTLSIRRLKRTSGWQTKFNSNPQWKSWFKLLLRLFPLFIFIAIPKIFVFLSGRVLSWERIFWMMPSIIFWLGTVAILNTLIVLVRIKVLYFNNLKDDYVEI